jgi:hypothetical protein
MSIEVVSMPEFKDAVMAKISCPTLKQIAGLQEQVVGPAPKRGKLQANYQLVRELGLPGNKYARVVKVEKLKVRQGITAVRLQIDNATYRQWLVEVAICDCPEDRHIAYSDFTVAPKWHNNPYEIAAD